MYVQMHSYQLDIIGDAQYELVFERYKSQFVFSESDHAVDGEEGYQLKRALIV